ncbi:hypothetical protein [Hydrocarboniphaga sp.]|uniref:hypothetical protein n=1 Tax=Hydrocarboniphaga sp. TaxID=2033016 RepID=UPI00260F3B16|nr:hypothetical protein [Hydrocarboniphaga sp.]
MKAQTEKSRQLVATPQIKRSPPHPAIDRPTQAEYIAWRIHVLSSPDQTDDCSGDVLPSGSEIRALLKAARRH